MVSVNFEIVRREISIAQVLELLSFHSSSRRGDQLRGPCPIHQSLKPGSRSFSVNLRKNAYRCFTCGAAGNQLDLWAAVNNQPIYEAAISLCQRLNLEIPIMKP